MEARRQKLLTLEPHFFLLRKPFRKHVLNFRNASSYKAFEQSLIRHLEI